MGIIDGIIGAVSSAATTAMSNSAAKQQLAQEQEFNRQEANKAMDFQHNEAQYLRDFQQAERREVQDWNLAQWNRENEYNSASAQLQRLIQAGINPTTAVGMLSGAGEAGQVQSSAQSGGNVPSGAQASTPSIASMIGNSANSFWTNMLNKAQTAKTEKETEYIPIMNEQDIKESEQRIKTLAAKAGLDEAETKQVEEMLPLLKGKSEAEIKAINQGIDESLKKIEVMDKQLEEIEQSIEESESRVALNQSQERVNNQQIYLINAQTAREWAQQGLIKAETLTEDALREGKVQLTKEQVNEAKSVAFKNNVDSFIKELQMTYGVNPNDPQLAQLVDRYVNMIKDNGTVAAAKVLSLFQKDAESWAQKNNTLGKRRASRISGLDTPDLW